MTIDSVDYVIAASVNDKHNPTSAHVHMIPGDVARDHFNRAYDARAAAGHVLPPRRGIWISLYEKEAKDPVNLVGAGMGIDYPAIASPDLTKERLPAGDNADEGDEMPEEVEQDAVESASARDHAPLTIPEAKAAWPQR